MAQTFKKGKKFAVVAFPLEDNEVAVVPMKWLFQGSSKKSFTCMWPAMLSSSEIKKLVTEAGNPDKEWNWYPVTVLHQCKSYEKAESAMKAHKSKSDSGNAFNHEDRVVPYRNQGESQRLSDESSEEMPSMEIEKVPSKGAGKRASSMQQTAVGEPPFIQRTSVEESRMQRTAVEQSSIQRTAVNLSSMLQTTVHPSTMQQSAVDVSCVKIEDSDDEAEDAMRAQQSQNNLENSFYHQGTLELRRTHGESLCLSNEIEKMPIRIAKVSSIRAERRPSSIRQKAVKPSSMPQTVVEPTFMQQIAIERSSMQRTPVESSSMLQTPVEPSSMQQTVVDTNCASCARIENSISKVKKFAIVEFIKDNAIDVIPSIWIMSSTEAKWPNISSASTIERYIRMAEPYETEWKSVHIKIYSYSNSFKKAIKKANILQYTSNLSSGSSAEDENPAPRKKRKPSRYGSPIEMEEESESEEHPLPNLPIDAETSKKNSVNRMLQYLESFDQSLKDLHVEIAQLKQTVEKLVNSESERMPTFQVLPSGLQLPVSSEVELYDLNENLKNDKEMSAILVRYLNSVGCGKSPSSFVLSLTKKIITAEVAALYSRYGRKGKKSFVNCHPETLNVILATAALKFTDVDRDTLGDLFGKALAGALDWNGRLPRRSDQRDSITFPCPYS